MELRIREMGVSPLITGHCNKLQLCQCIYNVQYVRKYNTEMRIPLLMKSVALKREMDFFLTYTMSIVSQAIP